MTTRFRFGSLLILCSGMVLPPQADAADKAHFPPVILLTVDDMSWDSVGVYGSAVQDPTPHIDRLAAGATRFSHAFVQVSVCTPSRHVMLSGQHSHATLTEGFVSIAPDVPTLPRLLKAAGYYTAIINKGVEKYGWDFQADRKETAHGGDPKIYARLVKHVHEEAARGGKPLFLMANAMDPHRPFHGGVRKEEWPEVFEMLPQMKNPSRVYRPEEVRIPDFLPGLPPIHLEMAQYYSSVRRADDVMGAILATLRELGIADEALIVFLSDHGISMPFGKASVYRESLRVPLLVKLPQQGAGPRVVQDKLVSAVDLAPTMLDVLGMPIPASMQGRSFKAMLTGDIAGGDWKYVYGYFYQGTTPRRTPMFTVQDSRYGYIVNLFHGTGKVAENSDFGGGLTWKAMVEAAKTDPAIQPRVEFHRQRVLEELYNYEEDPHALHNLIDDPTHRDVRERLTRELEAWMQATGCDALEAFRHRTDLAARNRYVAQEDAESLELISGKKPGQP